MAGPPAALYVDHGEGMGGAEHSLLSLIRHLDPAQFRAVLACDEGPLARAARAEGLAPEIVALPRLRGRPAAALALTTTARALAALASRHGAGLLHANTIRASFAAALAARLGRRPLVWHARDLYGRGRIGGRWYPRLMGRLADRVVAPSRAVARTIPRRDVSVIPNGVELERFQPEAPAAAVRDRLGLAGPGPWIGTVGRLQPWKGHHRFLEVAARLKDRVPEARFLVVGGQVFAADPGYPGELHRQAVGAGLAGAVHFAGHQADVGPWLAAMDVFVHCAEAEPFGRVVVEAMAAGRPVVAFADGGVPELVADGETGRLVPAGDEGAMAAAVGLLLAEPDAARALGRAGRRRAEARFGAPGHARAMEAVYAELVARAAGPSRRVEAPGRGAGGPGPAELPRPPRGS